MNKLPQLKQVYIQKLVIFVIFMVFTPITLAASSISLLSLNKRVPKNEALGNYKNPSAKVLSAGDTNTFPSVSSNIVAADGRAQIIESYFQEVDSELAPFSELLVATADKYNLDYRLLPAIAIKESGACRVIPPDSHNCWGWGIHSKGTLMFDDYPEAIEAVSKGLKENYVDKGYVTPEQIMAKYAHKDSTTWGPDVAAYMEALQ